MEERQLGTIHRKKNGFIVRRFDGDGKPTGEKTKWTAKNKSNLPRELFYKVRGFMKSSIKKQGPESMDELRAAGQKGLEQVAKAFGCQVKTGASHADLYWCVDGKRLIGWQVHPEKFDKRRAEKLERSKALFRLVALSFRTGYVTLIPLSTRRKDS